MSIILKPAVSLMNGISYPKKMAFISILFLVPLFIVSYLFIQSLTESISSTNKESRGLEYVKTVRQIFQHFPQHRGMTNAYLNGASEFKDKILAKRTEIKLDIEAIDEINGRFGNEFKTNELWASIKADWRKLEKNAFVGNTVEVFSSHTNLIAKVYSLFELISSNSGMVLDPKLNTFFLMDAVVYRIPNVTENFGKARGMGSGIAAKAEVSLKQRVELGMLLANIETNLETVNEDMRIAFEENLGLREKIGQLNDASLNTSKEFSALVESEILESESINVDANTVFASGTKAIKANYALYDRLIPILDELFKQRSDDLTKTRNLLLLMIIVGVIVAIYLFAGFYYSVVGAINSLDRSVALIAKGDLTVVVDTGTEDELKNIEFALNKMVSHLKTVVLDLGLHSEQLSTASTELSVITEQARNGALDQESQTEQISTAMNEMQSTVQEIAANAETVSRDAKNVDQDAKEGGHVVQETITSINKLSEEIGEAADVINQLEKNSIEIGTVLDVIRGIAEQTNLLALNAAIEAARAGEQGRGFAVVADEVRSLASRTQESTQQIQTMIESLQSHTTKAVQVMEADRKNAGKTAEQAGKASLSIEKIVAGVGNIMDMTTQVATAAEEQSSVSDEINRNVTQVADIAHSSVGGTEEIAQASEELSHLANELQKVVGHFKIN